MAPGLTSDIPIRSSASDEKMPSYPEPLKLSGALDQFSYEDTTPVIGREFHNVNIVDDLMNSSNADELLRDLAITSNDYSYSTPHRGPTLVPNHQERTQINFTLAVSQRGVVVFRAQDNLTNELQKKFIQSLGMLSGKPSTSTLHIHPVLNGTSEFGVGDNEISHISSVARKKMFSHSNQLNKRRYDAARWHSDIQFEECPADYTSLRLTQLPEGGGGDTLWASGYEIYDRFSRPYQKFFEGLTATFIGDGFIRAAEQDPNVVIYDRPRGSPQNVGKELTAVHPVVRTNPVTGWKSIFALGSFPKRINELDPEESKELLDKFYRMILDNHDLQVRFKWRNKNDIAIWDNRSVFHSATFDYQGDRFGNRAVGIGEVPFLNPDSQSRTEALGLHLS